jgi:hypothetical protein
VIALALYIAAFVVFLLAALGIINATATVICVGLALVTLAFTLERLAGVTGRRLL